MLQCGNRPIAGSAFQDLDRAFDGAKFALGKALQPSRDFGIGLGRACKLLPASLGEAQTQATPVVGIGGAFDMACTHEGIDGATDRRGPAPNGGSDLVQGRGFALGNSGEQSPPRTLGTFSGTVHHPAFSDSRKPLRKPIRGDAPVHYCSLANIGLMAMLHVTQHDLRGIAKTSDRRFHSLVLYPQITPMIKVVMIASWILFSGSLQPK
jgi:hypothetical protein